MEDSFQPPSTRTFMCAVVFLDIVDYSKKLVARQLVIKNRFNAIVGKGLENVAASDRIILDTGDGAALCFLGDPEDALFVTNSMRNDFAAETEVPELEVRIGINLGPVKVMRDLNGNPNIVGDGINVAQRVMSFAQANQILVSRSYYEVVSRLTQEYSQLFRFIGTREDKHVREHELYEVAVGGTAHDEPANVVLVADSASTAPQTEAVQPDVQPPPAPAPAPAPVQAKSINTGFIVGFTAAFCIAVVVAALIIAGKRDTPDQQVSFAEGQDLVSKEDGESAVPPAKKTRDAYASGAAVEPRQLATGIVSAAYHCDNVIGEWAWFIGGKVSFSAGARVLWTPALASIPPATGTWKCAPATGTFTVIWQNGFVDTLKLSGDSNQLRGTSSSGVAVWGQRTSDAAPES